jgi:hypothetical protein
MAKVSGKTHLSGRPAEFSELVNVADIFISNRAKTIWIYWVHRWKNLLFILMTGIYAVFIGLSFSISIDNFWLVIYEYHFPMTFWCTVIRVAIGILPFYGYILALRMNRQKSRESKLLAIYIIALGLLSLANGIVFAYFSPRYSIPNALTENCIFIIAAAIIALCLLLFLILLCKQQDIALYLNTLLQSASERAIGDEEAIKNISNYINDAKWKKPTIEAYSEIASARLQAAETSYSFLGTAYNLMVVLFFPGVLTFFGIYALLITGSYPENIIDFLKQIMGISELFEFSLIIAVMLFFIGAKIIGSSIRYLEILKIIWAGCILRIMEFNTLEDEARKRNDYYGKMFKSARIIIDIVAASNIIFKLNSS